MIVVDASAVLEVLLGTEAGDRVGPLLESGGSIQAPALLDVEVAQVVRRLSLGGSISAAHGEALLEILQEFPVDRRHVDPLLPRIWELRHNLTAYDASYVALAEALACPLITFDQKIAGAPGLHADVRVP